MRFSRSQCTINLLACDIKMLIFVRIWRELLLFLMVIFSRSFVRSLARCDVFTVCAFHLQIACKPSGNKERYSLCDCCCYMPVMVVPWLHLTASNIQYVIWIWKSYFLRQFHIYFSLSLSPSLCLWFFAVVVVYFIAILATPCYAFT